MDQGSRFQRVAELASALSATCADFGARQIEVVAAMSMMLGQARDAGDLELPPEMDSAVVEFVRALWGEKSAAHRH